MVVAVVDLLALSVGQEGVDFKAAGFLVGFLVGSSLVLEVVGVVLDSTKKNTRMTMRTMMTIVVITTTTISIGDSRSSAGSNGRIKKNGREEENKRSGNREEESRRRGIEERPKRSADAWKKRERCGTNYHTVL